MRPTVRRGMTIVLALTVLALGAGCRAVRYRKDVEPKDRAPSWKTAKDGSARYDGYANVAGDMEIAVVDYARPGSLVKVQLVGVVHIADAAYYKALQQLLDRADLVIYEGVGKGDGHVDKGTAATWRVFGEILGLAGQVEAIQYKKGPRWVQVDLATSPEEEAKALARLLDKIHPPAKKIAEAGKGGDDLPAEAEATLVRVAEAARRLVALKDRLGPARKRAIEDAMKHSGALSMVGDGQELDLAKPRASLIRLRNDLAGLIERTGRAKELAPALTLLDTLVYLTVYFDELYIIVERNKHVMEAVKREVARLERAGKPATVAVFYGAGHNADFDQRLGELGWKATGRAWHKAWAMNSRR